MIIYKDVISGDELLSDTFDITEEEDGIFYKVVGKMTSQSTQISDAMIGGNASAEEQAEELEEGAETGIDIVMNGRLQGTTYTKKDYQTYIKGYVKKIMDHLTKTNPDRLEGFKKAVQPAVKKILDSFKDWDFYTGESMNQDGMVILLNYLEDGATPFMLFFKDGLVEEKV